MAFLHSAYGTLGLPVYVIDFDTYEIIYTNRKCIEHFGEIKGRKCYDVLNDAENPCEDCKGRELLRKNSICSTYSRYLGGVEKYIDTFESIIDLPDGTDARLCLIFDVTEQEQLRQENYEKKLVRDDMQQLIDIQSGFIRSAKSMMSTTTLEGRLIFVNEVMSKTLGYEQSELLNKKISDFHSPDAVDKIFNEYIPMAMTEGEWKGDTEITCKDGSVIPIRQIIFPIHNKAGKKIALGSIMDDISIVKEMELMNRYQLAIMDSSRNYIGVSDLEGNTIYHNPGAYRMLGFEPGETEEWVINESHPEWYTKKVKEEGIPTAIEKGQWTGRGVVINRYGIEIPVEQDIFPVFDDERNIMGVATIIQNISEEVKHEKEMEAARRMLRAIIDTAPSAIFWKNKDSKFLGANKQFAKEAGVDDPDKLIGMSDYDFYPKEIAEMYIAGDKRIFETGEEMRHYEEPFQGSDGNTQWVSTSKVLIRDENDEPFALLGMYDDITKIKQNEIKLEETIKIAEKANHAKSDFLSRMSHEIRTPMNAIIGMTKIGQTTKDSAKVRYCLEKIELASAQLLGLINDILDMSKIEANKIEITEENFDFEKMIDNIHNVISIKAEEKKQELIVDIDKDIPKQIKSDEMRITQVITNLLSNSVKFTPNGGTVRLNVRNSGQTPNGGFKLTVTVSDNGIGLSEEQISKLFSAFEQAGSDISKKYGGTGLGLAISKRIVELMNGEIGVTSKLNEGSTFSFTIAVKECDPEYLDQYSQTSVFNTNYEDIFHGKKILLAEDIEINQEIVLSLLESTGITIDCVSNGKEAVEKFSENQDEYDLIIMDVQMPVMNGLEATQKIKALGTEAAKKIPIIAMTANAFSEDVESCRKAGMIDHVGKPIDIDILISRLQEYLTAY